LFYDETVFLYSNFYIEFDVGGPMVDFSKVTAIDFHTHAEEPCNTCRDDGYNEFQSSMAAYFKNPAGAEGMLPTV